MFSTSYRILIIKLGNKNIVSQPLNYSLACVIIEFWIKCWFYQCNIKCFRTISADYRMLNHNQFCFKIYNLHLTLRVKNYLIDQFFNKYILEFTWESKLAVLLETSSKLRRKRLNRFVYICVSEKFRSVNYS